MATMKCLRQLAAALARAPDQAAINKALRPSVGKRVGNFLEEVWYFSLLSNPATHVVNVTSTGINTAWQIPRRAIAAQFGKEQDSVMVGEATQMAYGMISSFPDALRLSWRALKDGTPPDLFSGPTSAASVGKGYSGSKIAQDWRFDHAGSGGAINRMKTAWNITIDAIGMVTAGPGRLIMSEDTFAQVMGKTMSIRASAFREGTKQGLSGQALARHIENELRNPSPHILEEAKKFGRELTFTTPLGPAGRGLQDLSNKARVLKIAMPFIRTPINLLKETVKHTPLALLHNDIRRSIIAGGPEGDLALAKIAMGGAVSAATWEMTNRGLITGFGPTDPELRAHWLTYKQPYSMKIGDTWYSYNRLDPFGMLVGAIASYAEISAEASDMDLVELGTAIAIATSASVTSKTWLKGPSELMEALMQPERFGADWVIRNMGTFLVPSTLAQITRTTDLPGWSEADPMWREVHSIADSIHARTPGYSTNLFPYRNMWGQKILTEGALGFDIISPVYKFGQKDRPIDEWIVENRVPLRRPSYTRNGVKMDPSEFDRFQELAGNELKDHSTGMGLYDTMDAFARGTHPNLQSVWNNATDGPEGGRAAILKNTVNAFREMAWFTVLEERPELMDRFRMRLEEQGQAMEETIIRPEAGREADYPTRSPTIGR